MFVFELVSLIVFLTRHVSSVPSYCTNDDGTFIGVVSSEPVTWDEAREYCQQYDSNTDLAPILSSIDDNNALTLIEEIHADTSCSLTTIPASNNLRYAWIGGDGIDHSDNSFSWIDGSEVDYINWGNGQPNNFNQLSQECLSLTGRSSTLLGGWNDENCDNPVSSMYAFICKRIDDCEYRVSHDEWGDLYISVVTTQPLNWNDANNYCQDSFGTHLAAILDQDEQDLALQSIEGIRSCISTKPSSDSVNYAWIGGKTAVEWTDEFTSADDYTNFAADVRCFALTGRTTTQQGKWLEVSCDSTDYYAFVCNDPNVYQYL